MFDWFIILKILFFFLSIKSSILTNKERVYRTYTIETTNGQQKRGKEKEESNKPSQTKPHLGIAIEPIQEQSNKVDICLWNKSSTRKQRSDN